MIEAIGNLTGEISTRVNLQGNLNKVIEIVAPTTQEKIITPTYDEIIVLPDEGVFALSKVTVKGMSMPSEQWYVEEVETWI